MHGSVAVAGMIHYFLPGRVDGHGGMREELGGKGANLAEMMRIGLRVPPGFTIGTSVCDSYYSGGGELPVGLRSALPEAVGALEASMGARLGDQDEPLLVSVRSGAAVSMPGMMDTILNLGLNERSVEGLAARTENARFAYDAYRRLIHMFGTVVMGIDHEAFEGVIREAKRGMGVEEDTAIPAAGLIDLCHSYNSVYKEHTGEGFPSDPREQLERAVEAVFKSWDAPRAKAYRRINQISGLRGTAVTVQAMVFGNTGSTSGTGVAFTRNPSTGEDAFFGEFLENAQGEDVVAGIRTPRPIAEMEAWSSGVYEQLLKTKDTLEGHFGDMQDIEFTVQDGELYLLQTRTGKRTGKAAVTIACELVDAGRISEEQAVQLVPAGDVVQLLLPAFDEQSKAGAPVVAKGLPASPGAVVGKPAFTPEEAVDRKQAGETVILVRRETSPEDVEGMHSAIGVLTTTGGMTSHAAVVARGWGKCCVVGAGGIEIDIEAGTLSANGHTVGRDDEISLDGATGEVLLGALHAPEPEVTPEFERLMGWADGLRRMRVRTNADTPKDAAKARSLGAEGIGLCRTEHMFFEGERIQAMRRMILAEREGARESALSELLPFQRADFEGIFRAMDGLPVTVRLLDPPLHEFLPQDEQTVRELAESLGVPFEKVRSRVTQLHESNPMMGHRGCRLALTYPEILVMQVRAITEACLNVKSEGVEPMPEIMIPLVGTAPELERLRVATAETIAVVCGERGAEVSDLGIPIGTMIEIPRACITADAVAAHADFFSFGTNDLTQLTYGYSRDDAGTFLTSYIDDGILPVDPFQTIDPDGVGRLVHMAVEQGRAAKPGIKLGICGEHGGDPESVGFCDEVGLDYVSCSPFRVPIARLAAAQATLRAREADS